MVGSLAVDQPQVGDGAHALTPGAAVLADALHRRDHQRIIRQPLLDRRQLAGGDPRGQHRRLLVIGPQRGASEPDSECENPDSEIPELRVTLQNHFSSLENSNCAC